jgi:hypothetical protein
VAVHREEILLKYVIKSFHIKYGGKVVTEGKKCVIQTTASLFFGVYNARKGVI